MGREFKLILALAATIGTTPLWLTLYNQAARPKSEAGKQAFSYPTSDHLITQFRSYSFVDMEIGGRLVEGFAMKYALKAYNSDLSAEKIWQLKRKM